MKITKSMLLPLVSLGVILYAMITGHEVPEELKNQILEAAFILVTFGSAIYGIYKNHHEPKIEEKEVTNDEQL